MNTSYHKDASHVNKTNVSCPIVPPIDFALVSSTLRRTFSTIYRLTARYGFCFASLSRIAEYCACSLSTVRKHVARLIREGMVRREEVPGYADRLFICPMTAWKNPPNVSQNGRTQRTNDSSPFGSTKTNKPPRRKSAEPATPPVVVDSAKASGEELRGRCMDLCNSQATGPELQTEQEDDPSQIASLLVASIEAAEGEWGEALGSGEVEGGTPCASLPRTSVGHQEIPPLESPVDATKPPRIAPEPPKQSVSPSAPVAAVTSETTPLTPQQSVILTQLVGAGVGKRQAVLMVTQDVRKAVAVLKAYHARIARGADIPYPGGYLYSCWVNPEWVEPVERSAASPGSSGMAKDLGYRIADRTHPRRLVSTTPAPTLDAPAASSLQAARRAIRGGFRD